MIRSPFVCRIEAFSESDRKRHGGLLEQVRSFLQEVRELPNGYAFRFVDEGSLFGRLAEWVRLESLCCPFLDFELRAEERSGPIWLSLTGPEGVKDFLKNQFPITEARQRQGGAT